MKFLFDLLPIILFFVSYQVYPEFGPKSEAIYFATGVAIAATFAQIAWVHFRHGKVDRMLWVSLAIIVTLGGATLIFHDKTFIMWKPTVLYWVFALALLTVTSSGCGGDDSAKTGTVTAPAVEVEKSNNAMLDAMKAKKK